VDGHTDHPTARWQEGGLSKASCDKTCRCRDQPSLAASVRRRLLAGKPEFCLPWTVRVDNLPVAFGDALRVKGSTCDYRPCDRQCGHTDAVRFQVSASIVAADRRAALPRETVAGAGIGWSANPPPVTRMVPEPAARMAGAATCATTMALILAPVSAKVPTRSLRPSVLRATRVTRCGDGRGMPRG